MTKAEQLFAWAQELANSDPEFHLVKGPGAGNQRNNDFVRRLQARATSEFAQRFDEHIVCNDTDLRADYYFPDEATIVEIALGLPNPNTEFEKDILKALVAKDRGFPVDRLIFISRPGARKKCSQPGRAAKVAYTLCQQPSCSSSSGFHSHSARAEA